MKEKKKRIKLSLKPSSRDKRRYFIVDSSPKKVEESLLKYLGILGFAKAAYMEVKSNELSGQTIGSCLVDSLEDVRAGLSLFGVRITKVSGTLKGLGMSRKS